MEKNKRSVNIESGKKAALTKAKKILVIDDEPEIIKLITIILEQENYKIISAYNGKEGLEKAANELPDLVLLDYFMPGVCGLDILFEIKKKYPDICVIMFTAYGDNEIWTKALAAGAYDVVPKPVKVPDLLAVIKKALL